jgi:hypothetical protein
MTRHAYRKTTGEMVKRAEQLLEVTRLRKRLTDIEDTLTLLELLSAKQKELLAAGLATRDLDQIARHRLAGDLGVAGHDLLPRREPAEVGVDIQRLFRRQAAPEGQRDE